MASVLKKPLCKFKKILICNPFLLNKVFMYLLLGSFIRANRRESLAPEPCQKIRCELRKLGALATSSPFEARKLRDYGKNEQRFADAQPCPASVTHQRSNGYVIPAPKANEFSQVSGAYKLNRSLNNGYLKGYIFSITLSQYSKIKYVMNIWQLFSRHYLLRKH